MTIAQTLAFTTAADSRGLLTAGQYPDNFPFTPIRFFIVTNSPSGVERGGHAHRQCHQLLIATVGSVRVEFDDLNGTDTVTLDSPSSGLYIPPLVWAKQTYREEGASLVVLASHHYDATDYIDDRVEASQLRETS